MISGILISFREQRSIAVAFRLERAFEFHANVSCLICIQLGQFHADALQDVANRRQCVPSTQRATVWMALSATPPSSAYFVAFLGSYLPAAS